MHILEALNLFQLREVYSLAISCDISESPQFKECFQLLGFQSQEELLAKLERVLSILESVPSNLPVEVSHLKDIQQELSKYHAAIISLRIHTMEQAMRSPSKIDIGEHFNRHQLKEVSAVLFGLVAWCDYICEGVLRWRCLKWNLCLFYKMKLGNLKFVYLKPSYFHLSLSS